PPPHGPPPRPVLHGGGASRAARAFLLEVSFRTRENKKAEWEEQEGEEEAEEEEEEEEKEGRNALPTEEKRSPHYSIQHFELAVVLLARLALTKSAATAAGGRENTCLHQG
ncbi:unnamed protein product, partial [Prorocentrum cordatum]